MAAQGQGFTVLPQFQGNLYDLQTKQALAQALMGQAIKGNQDAFQPAGGGFQYVPRMGIGNALAQALTGAAAGYLQREAGEGLTQLGQQQAAAFQQMFEPTVSGGSVPQMQVAPGPVSPGSFGIGPGGGFTGGSPDAGRVALGAALSQQAAPTVSASPLNPTGMDSRQAALLAQTLGLPDYVKEFVAPSYKPTETALLARAAGFTPEQTQAAAAGRIAQQNYIAPVAGGAGQVYRDPLNPARVIAQNPMVGENQEVLYRADGTPVIRTIEGAAQSQQELARAKALGAAGAEPIAGVDAAGNPVFTTKAAVAQGQTGGGQGPSVGRFGGYQAPGGIRPALSPAEQEGQVGLAKGNVANYNTLKDTASNSGERTNILDTLEAYANGRTTFGPGWTGRIENLAAINSKLPSGMAFGSNDVSNAQIVQKLASNLIQQYQKSMGGTGTDKQFELVMHGTPGADMTNKAMLEVIPKLKSMEVALQAKANAADSWLAANNNNPASLNKFETTWRQNYDPRIYQMSLMTPDQRAVFMGQQKDAAALKSKVQTALNNGWVQ